MAADFIITSLRGGLNDFDPEVALPEDQCPSLDNVEFWLSMCGEKRRGTSPITLGGTALGNPLNTVVPFLYRNVPGNDETVAELWAMACADDNSQQFGLAVKTTTWTDITPFDPVDTTTPARRYYMRAATLHGKMFNTYRSVGGVDRTHVWDGTTHRRTGLAQPSAPSVADGGGGGSYVGVRYFRVRFIVKSGSQILLRSEPSTPSNGGEDGTKFTPSGTNAGATITKPASISENETHWEIEGSLNDSDYYVITTLPVATTTFLDTTDFKTGYASFALSEDIGDYTVPWSAKFVVTDEDRVLYLGAWEQSALASTVGWSVVTNSPGVGNDERIPTATNNTLNLDGLDGGEITGASRAVNGYIFVFKMNRIYKLTRTTNNNRAYTSICISKELGAIPDSVVEGVDEGGAACLYFIDPKAGPCRLGIRGLQLCGVDILGTWASFNVDAGLPCRGLFYPDKKQVHYGVAVSGSSHPNLRVVLQTNHVQTDENNVARRGWTKWTTGRSTTAYAMCMFANNIESGGARSLKLVPFVGLSTAAGDRNLVQMCDTGSTDSGATYVAKIKTRVKILGGLLQKVGIRAGVVLATADKTGVTFVVQAIRDFGVEITHITPPIDLNPVAFETQVIRPLDDLFAADAYAIQLEFGDIGQVSGLWQVNMISAKSSDEETV